MVAWEGDGRRSQPLGHGDRGAVGHFALGLGSDADHYAGRPRAKGVEVVLVVRARDHVVPEEGVVPGPVVLGRQAEHGRIRSRLLGEIGRRRPLVADQRDELRHRRAEAAALVRLMDVPVRGQRLLAIRQLLGSGWFMRHERADLLGMRGHQCQSVHGAAAAGEDVHASGV